MDGVRGATWVQRNGDGAGAIYAATVDGSGWSSAQQIALVPESDWFGSSARKVWPKSEIPTISWFRAERGDDLGRFPDLTHLVIARYMQTEGWSTYEIPISSGFGIWIDQYPAIEVHTFASGRTVAAFLANPVYSGVVAELPPLVSEITPEGSIRIRTANNWRHAANVRNTVFAFFGDEQTVASAVITAQGIQYQTLRGSAWSNPQSVLPQEAYGGITYDSGWRSQGHLRLETFDDTAVIAWYQNDAIYGEDFQVWTTEVSDAVQAENVLAYEAIRPTWTRPILDVELDISQSGYRCLTYPSMPDSTLEARWTRESNWGVGLPTKAQMVPDRSPDVLIATEHGCLIGQESDDASKGASRWFWSDSSRSIPSAPLDMVQLTGNSENAVGLNLTGVNQIALVGLEITPISVTAPSSVTKLSVREQKRRIVVRWSSPNDLGGSDSVSFQYRINKKKWTETNKSRIVVRGKPGKKITVRMRAVNEAGPGPITRVIGRPK
jgi:hypothetical protein